VFLYHFTVRRLLIGGGMIIERDASTLSKRIFRRYQTGTTAYITRYGDSTLQMQVCCQLYLARRSSRSSLPDILDGFLTAIYWQLEVFRRAFDIPSIHSVA
jgi:hypothetical protein